MPSPPISRFRVSQWARWLWTIALTLLCVLVVLPFFRAYPSRLHSFLFDFREQIRHGFIVLLCLLAVQLHFKLLSPRIRHLKHLRYFPPTWLAVLVGWIFAAVIDLTIGITPSGYQPTTWEWLCYGVGSFSAICIYNYSWNRRRSIPQTQSQEPSLTEGITHAEQTQTVAIAQIPFDVIEAWLNSDEPAAHDFLNNQAIADRIVRHISDGTRSAGIVGQFGSGKTTIATWISKQLRQDERFVICRHSCWGFETSNSAIYDMLSAAIEELNQEIDTFHFDSLPEIYRQAISTSSSWADTLSRLFLRNSSPKDQFQRLSQLLSLLDKRLVFIVEDLDRNDTSTFEIQEVLGFLERLKDYHNLIFILTGGSSKTRAIDFAKLCDHIEILFSISPAVVAEIIDCVRSRCINPTFFKHISIGEPSSSPWKANSLGIISDLDDYTLNGAVALLLSTPRSIRHALHRTLSTWKCSLRGEIAFDDLLAANVLRCSAPESFDFLLRRWEYLSSPPTMENGDDQRRVNDFNKRLRDDWNATSHQVEWNHSAALRLIQFMLPRTEQIFHREEMLVSDNCRRQRVSNKRYWRRAVNDEIDIHEVPDQEILSDIDKWMDDPKGDKNLAFKLTTSKQYGDDWIPLATIRFHDQPRKVLLLCSQVHKEIMRQHNSLSSENSVGFLCMWHFLNATTRQKSGNADWLIEQIENAASISLKMVADLWYFYGSPVSGVLPFLPEGNIRKVMNSLIKSVRKNVQDGQSLSILLSSEFPETLYQLVFSPSCNTKDIRDRVKSWSWLGEPILTEVRKKNPVVGANCINLLGSILDKCKKNRDDVTEIYSNLLMEFFNGDANEIVRLLDEIQGQFPSNLRDRSPGILAEARRHLSPRNDQP